MFDRFVQLIRQRRILPRIILDVGAHDGHHSLRLAAAFPQATVHAFEAHPDFYQRCRHNLAQQPQVYVHHAAVGDRDGTVPFYPIDTSKVPQDPGASSLLCSSGRYDAVTPLPQRQIQVPGLRLVTWARQRAIEEIDLVWMDIQGAELLALRGMGNLFSTVQALCLEVSYQEIYTGQALFADVDRHLLDHGFACAAHRPAIKGWYGDAIYLRGNLACVPKARWDDTEGRVSEVLSDPTNLLIPRHPQAGQAVTGERLP